MVLKSQSFVKIGKTVFEICSAKLSGGHSPSLNRVKLNYAKLDIGVIMQKMF